MRVTLECNDQEAKMALNGPTYLSVIEDFWNWLDGTGREATAMEVRVYWEKLAEMNGIRLS